MVSAAVGDRVGRFTLVELIANPGSTQLWRAHDDGDASNSVAITIFESLDKAARKIDHLEAALAIAGIPELVGQGDNWIATRWINGSTLAHLIETEGPLPPDRVSQLIEQLAITVDGLHSVGWVHGNLNPTKVVVGSDGRVTLVGLGSSEAMPRDVAPGVETGDPVEPASDRYALALIAYEALTGESPLPPATSTGAPFGRQVTSRPVPVSERTPSLGTRFDRLFERALSKSPQARHATAQSFAAELSSPATSVAATADPDIVARRWKLVTLTALVVAALAMAALATGVGRSDETSIARPALIVATPTATPTPDPTPTPTPVVLPPGPVWPAGTAAGFTCNLLMLPDFEEDRLPDNWYAGDDDNSVALIRGAGVDNSTALRVGAGPRYGIVAERVPVDGGQSYHFSAWIRRQGGPTNSGMWLEYETADYVAIEGGEKPLFGPFDGLINRQGRRVTRLFDAPPEAAWAIPTFFKDASSGSVLVDEIVFGTASACRDVPT